MGAEVWLEKGLAVASRPRRSRRNKDANVAGTVDTAGTSQLEIIQLEEVGDVHDQQTQLQDENAQLKVEVEVLRQEIEILQVFQEIETIRKHEVEASKHEIEAYEIAKHVLCGDGLSGAHGPYNGLDTSLSISRVSNESCDY